MKKPFFAYRSFKKELKTKQDFAKIGVRQFCVFPGNTANGLGEPYSEYPSVWKWFDSYDFAPLDQQINDILQFCPDAEILLIIDLNSPLWLARQLGVRCIPSDSFPNLTGCLCESRRPSGLRKTTASSNSLAHRTTWLRSDFELAPLAGAATGSSMHSK